MAMCKISHHKVNEAEITVWHPNEDVESSNFSGRENLKTAGFEPAFCHIWTNEDKRSPRIMRVCISEFALIWENWPKNWPKKKTPLSPIFRLTYN